MREEGPEGPLEALRDHLSEKTMLLALDNFEHVMRAADVVTGLIDGCPGVRLVVTSREALRVQAEYEFPVTSMAAADAIELFTRRAAAVRHGFVLDEGNAGTLGRIVTALEGVPLAIELAAAQVRVLPPDAILERLDRRLEFLTDGAKDLPERQRALRTTMDWSYDLLDDDDKGLFATLGVFAGSFSLRAAEAVCNPDGRVDLLARLASLIDKSLLLAEASDREARFRMLLMVREYARGHLDAAALEAAGRRHAEHYRSLSSDLRQALRGEEQAAWVDRLGRGPGAGDIDNLRATLRWYLDHRDPDEVGRIVWSMWLLAWISGRLDECRRWAREALASHGARTTDGTARLLTVAGLFETWQGDYTASKPALTEAVAIARDLKDDDVLANALLGLSLVSAFTGAVDTAKRDAEEALALYRARGDRWGQATAFSVVTSLLVAEDDFESSGHVFEEALTEAPRIADELNMAMIEANGAEYRLSRGELDDTSRLLVSSLTTYRRLGALYPSSYAIDAAARFAMRAGQPETAAALLGAADRVRETIGVPVEAAHRHRRDRLMEEVRSQLGDVRLERALAEGKQLDHEKASAAAIDAITATRN